MEHQEMMLMENSEAVATEEWSMPVLDGRGGEVASDASSGINDADLAKFTGWGEDVIQRYLDNGWTIEQLQEYYQEQVQDNQ